MPTRVRIATVVPVTHSCGHRVEYPWDAWEVAIGRKPSGEPCAVCRRKEHHKITGKPYSIAVNPLTNEVTLWHDGWPFPMKDGQAEELARALTEASWRMQGKPLAENERVVLTRWIDAGPLQPFVCDDDAQALRDLLADDPFDPEAEVVAEVIRLNTKAS